MRNCFGYIFSICLLSFFIQPSLCLGDNTSDLPNFMVDLVFKGGEFAKPVQFCLPDEDSHKDLDEIRTTRYGLEKIFFNKGYNEINKSVLTYMIGAGFCEVESAKVMADYGGGNTHHFLFYTEKFNKLFNYGHNKNKPCINIAKRVLKSIDYQNKYKGSPRGVEVNYFAITFSYVLDGNMPELSKLNRTYEGKAKAYQDPDDGKWKLENLQLADDGIKEFLKEVEAEFTPYDPKKVPKKVPTSSRDNQSDNRIEREYYLAIITRLQQFWSLPKHLQQKTNLTAIVAITIKNDGSILNMIFERKSGSPVFDQFVSKTIEASSPMPPIPTALKKEKYEIGFRFTPEGVL